MQYIEQHISPLVFECDVCYQDIVNEQFYVKYNEPNDSKSTVVFTYCHLRCRDNGEEAKRKKF